MLKNNRFRLSELSPEEDASLNNIFVQSLAEHYWSLMQVDVFEKLQEHLQHLTEMNDFTEQKKAATAKEEYEEAIKFRTKAKEAKDQLIPLSEFTQIMEHAKESTKDRSSISGMMEEIVKLGDLQLYEHFKGAYLKEYTEAYTKRNLEQIRKLKREVSEGILIVLSANKAGIEKLRKMFDQIIQGLKDDTTKMKQFFEKVSSAKEKDAKIEGRIAERTEYKNFMKAICILETFISRLYKSAEIIKCISHIDAFDFESISLELEELFGIVKSLLNKESENTGEMTTEIKALEEAALRSCEICCHQIFSPEDLAEEKGHKYHYECLNYCVAHKIMQKMNE